MWKFIILATTVTLISSIVLADEPQTDKHNRKANTKSANQAKRDLSLSYAATDIDSKQGTRVKTITVIKNIGTNQKLVIDPELHKDDEWGSVFRDNFDSYAGIPDVPDVDDLFEFVKKPKVAKTDKPDVGDAEEQTPSEGTTQQPQTPTTEQEKPVKEESAELIEPVVDEVTTETSELVEKIKGDAELIPRNTSKRHQMTTSNVRLQSLSNSIGGRLRMRDSLINANSSSATRQASVRQTSDKYVNENIGKGYDYAKPCAPSPPGTVTVTTPSGRTYDIPLDGNNVNLNKGGNPYIAPSVAKKPLLGSATATTFYNGQPNVGASGSGQAGYPVNSLLPPLQQPGGLPNPVIISSNGQRTQNTNVQPAVGGYSTSQRPYIAPNVFNGGYAPVNRAPPRPAVFNTPSYGGSKNFRTNIFGSGANRPNTARSRGIKY